MRVDSIKHRLQLLVASAESFKDNAGHAAALGFVIEDLKELILKLEKDLSRG